MTSMETLADEFSSGAMQLESGPGALRRLPDLLDTLAPTGELVLLADATQKFVGAENLADLIADLVGDRTLRAVVAAEGPHGVTLDEPTVSAATAGTHGAAALIAVGSGTISDLGKVVGRELDIPVISVQTAASVNGYSDPLSVLVISGAKRTQPSAWPAALVIDHDVLAAAPQRLSCAGVGDAVAIWCAPADWYLSCAIGMDSGGYDSRYVDPVRTAALRIADHTLSAGGRLDALNETLTIGGLVIGGAGSTAPLSGAEHLISHVLDMAAMAEGAAHDLHGAQVGVASIVASALWDIALNEIGILELDPADLTVPTDLEQQVRHTWQPLDPSGTLGDECWRAVQAKATRWNGAAQQVSAFYADRPGHRHALRALVGTPEQPAAALRHWGAPMRFAELAPRVTPERARWALRALPFMRDRMTVTDLLMYAGHWNDDLFDRVLERSARAGGGL
ncbi:iron-containing alcohol dehydrogenase [Mycolicibacterium komossense]|uniref:Iron-containing alcohol dehydrogenase n=1 Tax=Mycolicibacterium komossense TaxID=1779 RepID=A0ABT3C6M0_9MYCO|nr:iron-containing alcohol dehydrogenase [Mycolicibacterium komossense]